MKRSRKSPKYQRKVQNTGEFLCQWQRRLEQKLRLKESKKFFVNLCRTFYATELWIVPQRNRQTRKIFHLSKARFVLDDVVPDFLLIRWHHFHKSNKLNSLIKSLNCCRMEELQEIDNKDEWNLCAVILNYKSVFAKQIFAFQGSN